MGALSSVQLYRIHLFAELYHAADALPSGPAAWPAAAEDHCFLPSSCMQVLSFALMFALWKTVSSKFAGLVVAKLVGYGLFLPLPISALACGAGQLPA